jgi:hypothetical protein
MKNSIIFSLLFLIILNVGCNMEKKTDERIRPNDPVFPKGEKITSKNFTGTVWLYMMGANDSTLHVRFGTHTRAVKYSLLPKARGIIRLKASQPGYCARAIMWKFHQT